MSGRRKRLKKKMSAQVLKVKRLSSRMKARVRQRHGRNADVINETTITLRSKFAWVTIVLMVLVIVAASIKVHPHHYKIEYTMTETSENPYMGTLDADDGYLVSTKWSWQEAEPAQNEYMAPALEPLSNGSHYVIIFNADELPQHVEEAAQSALNANEYISQCLNECIRKLCAMLGSECAYLQTDAELTGLDAQINGIWILSKSSDGLYRTPNGNESSWQTSPVAGSTDRIFGSHLTYTFGDEDDIAGRVGWALGIRYAEWHSFTRCGYRLFVNMTLDNAGVTVPYCAHDLVLSLRHEGEIVASEIQLVDICSVASEPVEINGYIDIPNDIEKGVYDLLVSINVHGDDSARLNLTMPEGEDGYYRLGAVEIK